MTIILKPFALLLGLLYGLVGNYGLAIILFGLIFKVILYPISIRGRKSMLDMSRLGDKQKELQQKYGKDRQQYSIELQKLYTQENVKPSGGCLWSLLPLPVLMALYFIVSNPFTHLMGLDAAQVTTLTEFIMGTEGAKIGQLGIAQQVYENFASIQASLPEIAGLITANGGPISFEFLGVNLSATPDLFFFQSANAFTWGNIGLFLIPVISAVFALGSMMFSMRINKKVLGKTTHQDTQNKQMMMIQPVISLWLGFTLPAALSLYWCTNYLFAILQDFVAIGTLKQHVRKMQEESAKRAEEQKEKAKEQKRAAAEQKKQKAEEARRIKMERKVSTDGIAESRVGIRAYARGRTFDQERYPVTEYQDPDEIIRQQQAERRAAAEAKAAGKVDGASEKMKKGKKEAIQEGAQDLIRTGQDEQNPAGLDGEESALFPESTETSALSQDLAAEELSAEEKEETED